ncbi:DUF47 family protein [Thermogladius sp. KZ2Tp1]|uniref:DUF47 domain-containing protein n=1 Tax=Thermogladius sp. KZ2Tp1 TaxID=3136289 RepID=UPI003DA822D3
MSEHGTGKRRVDLIKLKIVDHALKVLETVVALETLFSASLVGSPELDSLFEKVYRLEREADKLKREIISELRMAYVHPIDREDLLKMVTLVDDIAGFSKSASKRILAYTKGGLRVDEPYSSDIKTIIEASRKAVNELVDTIKSVIEGATSSLERLGNVEKLEKEVDDLRLKILEELYKECVAALSPKCVILPGLVDDLESITDVCEDVGVILKLMFSRRL